MKLEQEIKKLEALIDYLETAELYYSEKSLSLTTELIKAKVIAIATKRALIAKGKKQPTTKEIKV